MNNEDLIKLFQPIADTFKVAVTELWKIFVRQYTVSGINYLVSGGLCWVATGVVSALLPWTKLGDALVAPLLILPLLLVAGGVMIFRGIPLVANPAYYALDDVLERAKNGGKKESSTYYL